MNFKEGSNQLMIGCVRKPFQIIFYSLFFPVPRILGGKVPNTIFARFVAETGTKVLKVLPEQHKAIKHTSSVRSYRGIKPILILARCTCDIRLKYKNKK